jgi:hypothetical protein
VGSDVEPEMRGEAGVEAERHALTPPGPDVGHPHQPQPLPAAPVLEPEPVTQRSPYSSSPDATDPLVATILAERYRVLSLLGAGGMGSVYRGEHIHMRNAVAIKVLHPELVTVPEIVARFEREAIAAARINDPHVVNATDFGRLPDGSFYLVLEYVEGRDLATLLCAGALEPVRALRIARQIVGALLAAHAAGVIHRDLKPENVMVLERADEPDFVKVLDFGIAKVTVDDRPSLDPHGHVLTQLGSVFGTPQYMAPEQASGGAVDHRADLYTVGILLYEMLTGRPPFDDEEVSEVLRKQMYEPAPPLPAGLSRSLNELVMTQLAKEPEGRSSSAEQLLAWIDTVLQELVAQCLPPAAASAVGDATPPGSEPTPPAGVRVVPPQDAPARPRDGSRSRLVWWPHLGVAAALLGIAVVVGGAVVWFRMEPAPAPATSGSAAMAAFSTASAARLAPLNEQLLVHAATGDPHAIKVIEARDQAQRTTAEWLALARGRMELGRHKLALQAYAVALDADPSLTKDSTLLSHVRRAANDGETAEEALRIAALRLGSDGADLLYHVWVSTKAKTSTTQLARQLVYGREVRAKASPALAVALDLREAETCAQIKRLLPRATLHGDIRTYRILKPLSVRRGCGPNQREDCYGCLRQSSLLEDAMAAVRQRPEPAFATR